MAAAWPALVFSTGIAKAAVPSLQNLLQYRLEKRKPGWLPGAQRASPHTGTFSTSTVKTSPCDFARPIFVEAVISVTAIPQ